MRGGSVLRDVLHVDRIGEQRHVGGSGRHGWNDGAMPLQERFRPPQDFVVVLFAHNGMQCLMVNFECSMPDRARSSLNIKH
jgi:hypothetical protein